MQDEHSPAALLPVFICGPPDVSMIVTAWKLLAIYLSTVSAMPVYPAASSQKVNGEQTLVNGRGVKPLLHSHCVKQGNRGQNNWRSLAWRGMHRASRTWLYCISTARSA